MRAADPITDWAPEVHEVPSPALGAAWRVLVQAPLAPASAMGLPWLWLLHGRTASIEEMRPVLAAAGEAMARGEIPPLVIAAPDAPDDHRTSWWVDSDGRPVDPAAPSGLPLERSLLDEALPALESRLGGPAAYRLVGGISMGGGAALRWVIVRPDLFSAAVLLSPAVFDAPDADGSSYRRRDLVDVESDIFDTARYRELLHYPTLLGAVPADRPRTRVVTVVGDEEPVRESREGRHDLELEAARLHAALKVHPAFSTSLRVIGGGHSWEVWERGLVHALSILAGREET